MDKTIYLIEDDENIRELVRYILHSAGLGVCCFENGEDFLASAKIHVPHLILLDIGLPGLNGFELLKLIRGSERLKNIPVIFITARDTEIDKALGLDLGADDYISKPFGALELVARIKACLRRGGSIRIESRLQYKDLDIDTLSHEVHKGEKRIDLTVKEFELLLCFLENKGRVMTRDQLLDRLWDSDRSGKSRTVDMHVKTLRQKIGDSFHKPAYISTVRGIGYKLDSEWL